MSFTNDQNSKGALTEQLKFERLKDILLKEERAKVSSIQNQIVEPAYIEENIVPVVEQKMRELRENFPKEYEAVVNKLIEEKIKNSQDDIVNIIYPSIGKMIKKYVNLQIQSIKEGVDERVKNAFTFKGFLSKIKTSITGIDESDVIISNMMKHEIEEVYLIQKDSGLLMGSASKEKTVDKDVIAGMLTAIKAFVEDAFKREQEDLESIQYGSYQIILQSFYSCYIALAISGSISSKEQNVLGDKILDYAEKHLKEIGTEITENNRQQLSKSLYDNFFN